MKFSIFYELSVPRPWDRQSERTVSMNRLIRVLKDWEVCDIDRVHFVLNAAQMIPREQVLNSLHFFAKKVMPAFAERQPAQAATGGR